jgi:hypothetical protein
MQDQMESALLDSTTTILAAGSIPDSLRIVRARWHELDVAILDADTGSHGRVMLHAIRFCREELPILATISGKLFASPHVSSHRAAGCLSKPFTADELRFVLDQISRPERGRFAA